MGDVPQSPRARAGSTGSTGAGSQSNPSSPFTHLVHRSSFIDLKALASPNDEEEHRDTDWSAYVDDSPTQRRSKINPGRLSSQLVSPAEEEALRTGKRWARPGSDVVPPLLPELFDTEGRGNDGGGLSRSENRQTLVRSGGSNDSDPLSIFSNGSSSGDMRKASGSVHYFPVSGCDDAANGTGSRGAPASTRSASSNGSSPGESAGTGRNSVSGSVPPFQSNGSERGVPRSGSRRTSSSVRSVLSRGVEDHSSAASRRGGSQGNSRNSSSTRRGRGTTKFLPDDAHTVVTDDSGRSLVGDLEAADIPLEHVHMSHFSSRDEQMPEDFSEQGQRKRRRIGLWCCLLLCILILIVIIIVLSVVISELKKQQIGNNSIVNDAAEPVGVAAVADLNPTTIPSTAPVTQAPTLGPVTSEPSSGPSGVPTTAAPSGHPSIEPTTSEPSIEPSGSPTSLSPTEGGTQDWLLALLMKYSPYPERLVAEERNAPKRAYLWLAEDPRLQKYSERRIIQRWVLATAFYSQKDPWLWSDWKDHPDECVWRGISCKKMDNDEGRALKKSYGGGSHGPGEGGGKKSYGVWGHGWGDGGGFGGEWIVTGINVQHSFLEGVIPEEISLLEHLTELNLHGNVLGFTRGFHGTIPTELGELKQLEYLNLSYNSFEGTVPTELAALTKLIDLRLARNSLEGTMPEELCHRGNMCYLSADCSEVECDFGCCTRCCKDGGLCCYDNGICFF